MGQKHQDIRGLFRGGAPKDGAESLKEIASFSSNTSWHSPAPERECLIDSESDFARLCASIGNWGVVGTLFLACFLSGKNMVVKCEKYHGTTWYLPWCDSGHPAKFGWPLTEKSIMGTTYFELTPRPTVDQTPFLHCFCLADWQACELTWVSPFERLQTHGRSADVASAILARRSSDPEAILRFAAKRGFFDLTPSALTFLAKHLRCDLNAGEDTLSKAKHLAMTLALAISPSPGRPLQELSIDHDWRWVICAFMEAATL